MMITERNSRCSALVFLALAVVTLLPACSHKPGDQAARPQTIQKISNSQRMEDVVAWLEDGDVARARKALKDMVRADPSDRAAASLLETVDADPTALLGAKSFAYRIQSGDRMSEISRRFLGDRLKFYALAPYNGLAIPSSIRVGQLIRIPGDEPPPRVAPAPKAPAPSPKLPEIVKPAPSRAAPKEAAADPAKAAKLRAAGLAALNQGQVARAVVLLHQAATLAPSDALIRRDLDRAQRIRKTVQARR